MDETRDRLLSAAVAARPNSHSPYSRFKVAAAVLTTDDKIFTGVNVENASYGGTVCAERVAIWKAVSEGAKKIKEMVVVTDSDTPWPPCGLCRQVMSEFCSPQTPVLLANLNGIVSEKTMGGLLPESFGPEQLGIKPE